MTLCAGDQLGVTLGASARPVSGTTINLVTSNVPAGAAFSANLVNFAAVVPGINLVILGAPDCFQHIALGGSVTLGIGFGASWSQPFAIPSSSAYVGTNVFSQSAAIVPGANPLGVTTSNGVRLLVGNL